MTEPTHTILLAEENPASRAFLAENLTADGFEVLEADSKEKALALLSARQPELVLADVNGETLSLVDAVREADGLASRIDSDTPLMILSARADELVRVRRPSASRTTPAPRRASCARMSRARRTSRD